MFGVAEDVLFDATTSERDERVIARSLFATLVLFAPGFYWLLVASAWAPIPYFIALGIAEPGTILMTAIPVAVYAALDWWFARSAAMMLVLLDQRWMRFTIAAAAIALIVTYATLGRFQPLHGYDAPRLGFIELLRHAFGPQLPGVC